MILVRYDRLLGVESVDEQFDDIAAGFQVRFITVGHRSKTRQIETGH